MMRRLLLRGFVLLYGLSNVVMTSGATSSLTANDVRPLLNVISRLATLRLTGQQALAGSFGVCFADDEAFKPLTSALRKYKGNVSWLLVSRPPGVCLVAAPDETKLRNLQISSESQLKDLILQDVLPLSSFLEEQLGIVGAPSRGIQAQNESPADRAAGNDLGGPALLVYDPDRYIESGFRSTSGLDRTIDFWMSEQEIENLYSVLHPAQSVATGVGDLPILSRASESTRENFIVLPKDVAKLRHECETLAGRFPDLSAALQRVIRICNLAEADHLGILVIGG